MVNKNIWLIFVFLGFIVSTLGLNQCDSSQGETCKADEECITIQLNGTKDYFCVNMAAFIQDNRKILSAYSEQISGLNVVTESRIVWKTISSVFSNSYLQSVPSIQTEAVTTEKKNSNSDSFISVPSVISRSYSQASAFSSINTFPGPTSVSTTESFSKTVTLPDATRPLDTTTPTTEITTPTTTEIIIDTNTTSTTTSETINEIKTDTTEVVGETIENTLASSESSVEFEKIIGADEIPNTTNSDSQSAIIFKIFMVLVVVAILAFFGRNYYLSRKSSRDSFSSGGSVLGRGDSIPLTSLPANNDLEQQRPTQIESRWNLESSSDEFGDEWDDWDGSATKTATNLGKGHSEGS